MTNMTNNNLVTPDTMAIRSFNEEQSVNNWLSSFDMFEVKENGEILCKASEEALGTAETQSLAVALLWEDGLDTYLIGEDGCAGNFDMYTPIFIARFNCYYLILHSVSEEFKEGKTVWLYPRDITKEELEEGLEWANNH